MSHSKGNMSDSNQLRECVQCHTLLRLGGISVSDHLRECVHSHTENATPQLSKRMCAKSHDQLAETTEKMCAKSHMSACSSGDHLRECVQSHTPDRWDDSDHPRVCVQSHTSYHRLTGPLFPLFPRNISLHHSRLRKRLHS